MSWDPFLMKVLLKKEVSGSREQCTGPIGKPWNAFLKKEKKKKKRVKHRHWMWLLYPNGYLVSVWILLNVLRLAFMFCGTYTHDWKMCLSMDPVHCSWDPQTSFFSKIFIKNGFHGIIHTFKNYFATIFSVFNFQQ